MFFNRKRQKLPTFAIFTMFQHQFMSGGQVYVSRRTSEINCVPKQKPLEHWLEQRIAKKCVVFSFFNESVTDRPTDRRTDGPTDGRTDPLIGMRGRMQKLKNDVIVKYGHFSLDYLPEGKGGGRSVESLPPLPRPDQHKG